MTKKKASVIVCNYTKGGAGKTTLAVHITGMLREETAQKVLLVDCDPRPDSWKFFSGGRPKSGETLLQLTKDFHLRWNPPQPKGERFKPIVKQNYVKYDYIVIDTDSPPEDSLTILENLHPDILLVPIAQSQSHAIEDMSIFLSDIECAVREVRYSGIDYRPIVKVAPLGLTLDEIKAELDIDIFSDIEIQICTPMECLPLEITKSLKEKNLIWNYANLEYTKDYFRNLIWD